jgi:hypothetical protein
VGGCRERFADGEFRVGVDCSDGVGPQCAMACDGESGLKWCCYLRIGGVIGLLVKSAL